MRRKIKAQEKIKRVFINLVQEKEISKITVSEIVSLAGVNRSTFYANYADIYDLRDDVKKTLENEIKIVYKDEIENEYNSNDFLKLFKHIKENELFYKTYFKLGFDVENTFHIYDYDLAEKYFNNEFVDYHIVFFKNGLNAIIKKWLDDSLKESPEEINSILKSEYNRIGLELRKDNE